jgi:7,8-dihydroneopterin aldolase/epimerase/oxygenase
MEESLSIPALSVTDARPRWRATTARSAEIVCSAGRRISATRRIVVVRRARVPGRPGAYSAVMDTISIRGLGVAAVIGARDWERGITQTLVFSVDMVPATADVRKAAATDDLADALDYSAVARTISAVVAEGRFRLIETAAERVAERLLADHPVTWLRLEVRKPIDGGAYTAAVTIERGTRPA